MACGRSGPDPERVSALAERYDRELDCSNTVGLFPAEIRTRDENEYVADSPHAAQKCFNCVNFVEPDREGACGACTTVKGPIHPLGWCKSWTWKR